MIPVQEGRSIRYYLKFDGDDRVQLAYDCADSIEAIERSLRGLRNESGSPLNLMTVAGPTDDGLFSMDVALQVNDFTGSDGKPFRVSGASFVKGLKAQLKAGEEKVIPLRQLQMQRDSRKRLGIALGGQDPMNPQLVPFRVDTVDQEKGELVVHFLGVDHIPAAAGQEEGLLYSVKASTVVGSQVPQSRTAFTQMFVPMRDLSAVQQALLKDDSADPEGVLKILREQEQVRFVAGRGHVDPKILSEALKTKVEEQTVAMEKIGSFLPPTFGEESRAASELDQQLSRLAALSRARLSVEGPSAVVLSEALLDRSDREVEALKKILAQYRSLGGPAIILVGERWREVADRNTQLKLAGGPSEVTGLLMEQIPRPKTVWLIGEFRQEIIARIERFAAVVTPPVDHLVKVLLTALGVPEGIVEEEFRHLMEVLSKELPSKV